MKNTNPENTAPGEPKRALIVGMGGDMGERWTLRASGDHQWNSVVVGSANEAFAVLERAHETLHALAVDERLPLHDAEALLTKARSRYPKIAGIALRDSRRKGSAASPFFIQHSVAGAMSTNAISDLFQRTYALQQAISPDRIREICGEISTLPAAPATYWELNEAMQDPDVTATKIADIVQSDPAISAKVLQLVNSAFFGLARRTASIPQAISLLGLNMLRGLVLSVHVFRSMSAIRVPSLSLDQFQAYSIRVARAARRFSPTQELGDEAFTAGLVHDIGTLVLALRAPVQLEAVLDRVRSNGEAQEAVERELLGTTHSEVGAYLLSAWGLPSSVLECVAFHHEPHLIEAEDVELLAIVHAAEAMVGIVGCADSPLKLSMPLLRRAGLENEVDRWSRIIAEDVSLRP